MTFSCPRTHAAAIPTVSSSSALTPVDSVSQAVTVPEMGGLITTTTGVSDIENGTMTASG